MFSLYLFRAFAKNNLFSSFMDQKDFKTTQNTSSSNDFIILFVLEMVLFYYLHIFEGFGFNEIRIKKSILIRTKSSFPSNFFPLFFLKGLKTKKTTKQMRSKYSLELTWKIRIPLLIILILGNLEKPKQITKYLKKDQILRIVPKLWLSVKDTIYGTGFGCENENIAQGRSYENKNIDISYCFFSRSSVYSGNGGVIFVDGGSYSMNVNYSMFYNCACSEQGGAIYFYSTNSCLRMICANRCSSSSNYQFAYLSASQVNHVEYVSIQYCSHTTSRSYSNYLNTGNQRVDNTNSSMNYAFWGSGIIIMSPSSFTSSHCTFSNNVVIAYICVWFSSNSGSVSMTSANIVNNNSPSNYGVVYAYGGGSKKMMYCIYQNNQNYLFNVESGSLEVSHSFIYHLSSFSSSRPVSTETNNSFIERITYRIQFFNSHHCNADIPLIEKTPINTIEKSPMRSLEKTNSRTNEETLRMTYEKTIDQTIIETIKETIPRTYSECIFTCQIVNWRGISDIFSFYFKYPLVIILVP